jgi:hypothetical protein
MAGQVAQGDLPVPEGRYPYPGWQVAGQRIVEIDDALLGQVGQQQPGEHLGDGADLEDRAAIGEILGVGADPTIPDHVLLAALQASDHQADAPARPHGPLGQEAHRIQPNRTWWSPGCSHALPPTLDEFASAPTAPAIQTVAARPWTIILPGKGLRSLRQDDQLPARPLHRREP